MSVVSLLGVKVLNNPANFSDPYEFEITFECLEQLQKADLAMDLEWKLTYVGSATSSEHDQELDSLLVGPIPIGVNKFIFEADPPDLKKIPSSEILGVTVILLTCAYDDREFVRVGYYVNNEYDSEELIAEPPAKPIIERVRRNVLAEKPRVTRFAIKWDSEDSAPAEYPPDQPEADTLDDDGTAYGAEEAEMQAALERELAEAEKLAAAEEQDTKAKRAPSSSAGASTAQSNGADVDAEMAGTDEAAAKAAASATKSKTSNDKATAEDEDDSDAGSEDLEAESSGSEDEDEEEGEGEGEGDNEGDEDVEMGEDGSTTATTSPNKEQKKASGDVNGSGKPANSAEVMVH